MTIAKAVVTGIVYKEPKTGYTQNNVAVSSFVLNIGTSEELLVRVISKRQALSQIVESLTRNQKVLVSGRLQTGVSKRDDGSEKRVFELDAEAIELYTGASSLSVDAQSSNDILTFGEMEAPTSDVGADAMIEDEEIPF